MSKLDKLYSKYSTQKEKDDYKSSMVRLRTGSFIAGVSLIVVLVTVLLLFMDKVSKVENGEIIISKIPFIMLGVAGIFLVLFLSLSFYTDKKIIKRLSTQHTDFLKIIDVFKNIENGLSPISKNLREAPISNLITWGNSKDIEIESKEVWAYSYSLEWLTKEKNKRIKEILVELLVYPTHRYLFITPIKTTNPNLNSNPIKKAISEFKTMLVTNKSLSDEEREVILKYLHENLINKFKKKDISEIKTMLETDKSLSDEEREKNLNEIDLFEKLINKFENEIKLTTDEIETFGLDKRFCSKEIDYSIPIPNDFAIYKGFREGNSISKNIVVFNTGDFKNNDNSADENKYDLRFFKKDHVDNVESWFVNVWKEKTGQDLYD